MNRRYYLHRVIKKHYRISSRGRTIFMQLDEIENPAGGNKVKGQIKELLSIYHYHIQIEFSYEDHLSKTSQP